MAESAQTPIPNPTCVDPEKSDKTIDPRLVECFICTGRLKQPKTLPCLHTFCQICLQMSIAEQFAINNNSTKKTFLCPSCKQTVSPINDTDESSLWAGRFPTYSLVFAAMKALDLQTVEQFCMPCYRRDKKTKATCWCKQCDVKICPGCKDTHNSFFTTHDIIPLTDVMPKQMAVVLECSRHKETLKLYCVDHACLGCTTCMAIDHRKCETIRTAAEHMDTVEIKETITTLERRFSDNINHFEKLETQLKDKSESDIRIKEKKLAELKERRKEIDKALDNIQSNAAKEIESSYASESSCNERKASTWGQMKNLSERSLCTLRFAVEIGEESAIIQELKTRSEECELLNIRMNTTEEEIMSEMAVNNDTENNLVLKRVIGMIEAFYNSSGFIPNHALPRGSFDVEYSETRLTGVLFLPNSRIIVVDNKNKKVALYTEEGSKMTDIVLDGPPWDLCLVDESTIAVSISSTRSISMISITEDKFSLKRTLKLKVKPNGIAYADGKFLVTCPRETSPSICTMNTEGELLKQLVLSEMAQAWHSVYVPQTKQFIISTRITGIDRPVVYTCNLQGNESKPLVKNHLIDGPRGLGIDKEGNLYICGTNNSTIGMVSSSGKEICLLSKQDGLKEPCAVSVVGTKMAVVEEGSRTVRVYRLI